MDLIQEILLFTFNHWLGICVSLCIATLLYLWGIAPYRRSAIVTAVGDIPGPTPLPFLGHLLDILKYKGQLHDLFEDYYKKYGRLFAICLFSKRPCLMISDPEMVKDILVKEFHCFHDRPIAFELPEPFDDMLSLAKGESWHRMRTILSPNFSSLKLKFSFPLINKSCDLMEKRLNMVAKTGETIDIYKYFQGLTMEVILATFFGIECSAQLNYDDPAFKAGRESLDPGPVRTLLRNLISIIPFGSYLIKYFPSFFLGNFYNLIALAENVIHARRQTEDFQRKDFLDSMLSRTDTDTDENIPGNKRLSELEVIAQSMIFMFAGYETTSNTLALTCHHLIANPHVQERLQKEIDDVWNDQDQQPSYDIVQSLPYLDMVINETLRLYPPGFLLSRECVKDCVIKGLTIRKGTPIIIPAYNIHRDPDFYPEPEKFYPERFTPEAVQSRDPYTYIPFGHGPRNCIGIRFAQMEMKLALVRFLKNFKFIAVPETNIPPKLYLKSTLGCGEGGVKLRVERRQKQQT